jgi:hypothetical protein
MSTPGGSNDVQHLAAEAGRLFGLYHEQVDRLQTERAQENERLRADLGRLDALQAETARSNQDNDRLRADRDELLVARPMRGGSGRASTPAGRYRDRHDAGRRTQSTLWVTRALDEARRGTR